MRGPAAGGYKERRVTPSALNPIGVFDSGVGGLTVYKALRTVLPCESFVYLGDTARLPYGTKSAETVAQYALQAARRLMREEIKLLVVACNTASALALPVLRNSLDGVACLGVIEPGAREAARTSKTGHIAVLATESTVRSGSYAAAIRSFRPDAEVRMLGCNLLVSLAEAGWHEGPEAEAVIARYLRELGTGFDTLVLGCTHFPLLVPAIRNRIGPEIAIVDSAVTTARSVRDYLAAHNLRSPSTESGKTQFWATDTPECFTRIAWPFLGDEAMPPVLHVQL